MAWILRLVKIGTEGDGHCTDVMEINRPDDLGDIADLGLTLAEGKLLLAGIQREIVAAQARDQAVQRPDCLRCGGAFRPGHGPTSPISLCRVWRRRGWRRLAIALPIDT